MYQYTTDISPVNKDIKDICLSIFLKMFRLVCLHKVHYISIFSILYVCKYVQSSILSCLQHTQCIAGMVYTVYNIVYCKALLTDI